MFSILTWLGKGKMELIREKLPENRAINIVVAVTVVFSPIEAIKFTKTI